MEFTGIRVIRYSKKDAIFKFWNVADQHFTNRAVAWHIVHRDIELIKNDNYAYFVEGGDYADWHLPSHPYFDAEAFSADFKVNELTRYAAHVSNIIIDLYKPIAHKCLGWAYGNHDHNYFIRHNDMAVHEGICQSLEVPNLRYSGWMTVYFVLDKCAISPVMTITKTPPKTFTSAIRIYVHHGKGAASTPGGKMNALRDIVGTVDADLVMTSHLHEQLTKPFTRILPGKNCTEAEARTTMALITGSYLRNYQPDHTGYAEKKALPVTTLGAAFAKYCPETLEMSVEIRATNVGIKGNQR